MEIHSVIATRPKWYITEGTLVNWVTVTGHKEDYKIKILFRDEE